MQAHSHNINMQITQVSCVALTSLQLRALSHHFAHKLLHQRCAQANLQLLDHHTGGDDDNDDDDDSGDEADDALWDV